VNYTIQVAALDTTNDGGFDTLVFFETTNGIKPGPFHLPSTGPAYVKASDKRSGRFYLESSPKKSGTGFYVSILAPDLSNVHVARYSITDMDGRKAISSSSVITASRFSIRQFY
jgi:hypothetical protein